MAMSSRIDRRPAAEERVSVLSFLAAWLLPTAPLGLVPYYAQLATEAQAESVLRPGHTDAVESVARAEELETSKHVAATSQPYSTARDSRRSTFARGRERSRTATKCRDSSLRLE
jgi:hypothetical protein